MSTIATVTIKLTPDEFDTVRSALKIATSVNQMEGRKSTFTSEQRKKFNLDALKMKNLSEKIG